ncbi:MAG: leucine-rich repeat domain-containing protein [Bacteroidales bacterium]|nr:leucine-rich repeat domain-containing protein [Bacteroidales bacterium]
MKNKLQSFGLAALLLFACQSLFAYDGFFWEDGIYYGITSRDKCTVSVCTENAGDYSGEVIIPGTVRHGGAEWTVTAIGGFWGCSDMTSVSLPNTIVSIGMSAFNGCGLTSITIPNSVREIDHWAFESCKNLKSVDLGNGVERIGYRAFIWCENLESITIPSSVTQFGDNVFGGCTSLKSATIKCSSVSEAAFSGCTSLENVSIGNSVTKIGKDAFSYCKKLTTVSIPSSVTSIGDGAFNQSGLTSVSIPNSVTELGNSVFSDCSDLESVTLSKNITSIGSSSFNKCTKLSSIEIPDGVTSIGASAFNGCKSLTSIEIPNGVIDYGVFWGCSELKSVTLGNGVTSIGSNAFRDDKNLETVIIGNGVTSVGEHAFYFCEKLESVAFPNNEIEFGESVFEECKALTTVTLPDKMKSINNNVFRNCKCLKNVNLSEDLTSIGRDAFFGCESLESVEIPKGVTKIGWSAFNGCKSLKSVSLPKNLTEIEYEAFLNCTSLASIEIPSGVIGNNAFRYCQDLKSVVLGDGVTRIGEYAFNECKNMTSLTIGKGVTSVGQRAFQYCEKLESAAFPNNEIEFGEYVFEGCKAMTTVTLPEKMTSINHGMFKECNSLTSVNLSQDLTKIMHQAFFRCFNLENIELPSGVTEIGSEAFCQCGFKRVTIPSGITCLSNGVFKETGLVGIVIPEGVSKIEGGAFSECKNLAYITVKNPNPVENLSWDVFYEDYQATLYVPAGSVSAYSAAVRWKEFSSIQEIPSGEQAYADLEEMIEQGQEVCDEYKPGSFKYCAIGGNDVLVGILTDALATAAKLNAQNSSDELIESYYAIERAISELKSCETINVIPNSESNVFDLSKGTFKGGWRNEQNGHSIEYGYEGGSVTYDVYSLASRKYDLKMVYSNPNSGAVVTVSFDAITAEGDTIHVSSTDCTFEQGDGWDNHYECFINDLAIPAGRTIFTVYGKTAASSGWVGNFYGIEFTLSENQDPEPEPEPEPEPDPDPDEPVEPIVEETTLAIADGTVLSFCESATYDKLSYTRNFGSTNWQALYVPFSIPLDTLFAHGLQLAELNDTQQWDFNGDGIADSTRIEFFTLTSGATEPNYPYLIRATSPKSVTLYLEDVEVSATEVNSIECSSTKQVFTFAGTYTGVSGTTMYGNNYYAMSGGGLKRASNSTVGLGAQRWYMDITNKNGSDVVYYAPAIRCVVDGIEEEFEVSGIDPIAEDSASDNDVIYSLDGVRQSSAKRGMHVRKGRKHFIR